MWSGIVGGGFTEYFCDRGGALFWYGYYVGNE